MSHGPLFTGYRGVLDPRDLWSPKGLANWHLDPYLQRVIRQVLPVNPLSVFPSKNKVIKNRTQKRRLGRII